jgi:hypothetical protein
VTERQDETKRKAREAAKRLREQARKLEQAAGKAGAEESYRAHSERMAAKSRAASAEGREIGAIPAVKDPERRARCAASLLEFAKTYFPARFPWSFSPNHRAAGDRIDRCSDVGGLFALAMERGSGKTTLAEVAVIRNVVYGRRRFVLLVQAIESLGARSLEKIQREFEGNDLLLEDFPEVCYPIRCLERIHNRAKGQTHGGRPTRIKWTSNSVTLPDVEGSAAAGAVILTSGITGAVRGLSMSGPGGEILRPDMVLIDDAQTRDSAKSPTQTADRESIITDDILGLAGPGTQISCVMLCTVIYQNDLSDRFLSPDRHPEWQGMRTSMVESFPERMDLWDEYQEARRESFRSGDEGRRGTEFYLENREAMDKGAVVSWPERMKPGEASAIQSAMNLLLDNPRGFWAEYMNKPQTADGSASVKGLIGSEVVVRLSGVPRGVVPRECSRLTSFVDVGGEILWYVVVAWSERFGGSVIDYGSWPRQNRSVFAANDPRPSLSDRYPGRTDQQRVFLGLTELFSDVVGRVWKRDGGGEDVRIDRCLVDSGWQAGAVYEAIRAHQLAAVISPSKGFAKTTTSRGVGEWKPRPGERSGAHWRLTLSENSAGSRVVQFDPDPWKSFTYQALTIAQGAGTALTLFGKRAADHQMIAEHLEAETAEPVTIRGITFDKWVIKPDRPDNHWLDCVVGAAVAASVTGLVALANESANPAGMAAPKPMRLSDIHKAKHGGGK